MSVVEQGALESVRRYLGGYSSGNIDESMSVIASSAEILLFGTNIDEVFRSTDEVRTALERDAGIMTNIQFGDFRSLHLETAPSLAFVLLEVPVSYEADGQNNNTLMRMGFSLVQEDGMWKISSGMVSVPFGSGSYSF
ncbi:MAG: nuclear transport factor 2 family protein [Chlorobiaceae bacterium]|nr:nuclear transport factor 2 family protein [Chlorobiaceae bacterium]